MTSQYSDTVTPEKPDDATIQIFKLNPIIMIDSYPKNMFGANNGSITAYFNYDETTFLYEGLKQNDKLTVCQENITSTPNSKGDFSNYSLYLDSTKGEWNILKKSENYNRTEYRKQIFYSILAKNQCNKSSSSSSMCIENISKIITTNWIGVNFKKNSILNINIKYYCAYYNDTHLHYSIVF